MNSNLENDLTNKYSKWTIVIHWASALLILILFPLGKYMTELQPSDKMGLVRIHMILGILIFILTSIRTWQFFKVPRPPDLKTGSKFVDKFSVWVHNLFYFILLGLSISGIATMAIGGYANALQTGDSDLVLPRNQITPLNGHSLLAMILAVLLFVHVVGVIKHIFLRKENPLKRIL
ncbi:MAG: cytochrome b/b6 domain-containing protein [bacterium]|nr:cytochrome b/b6 domain-containing protein [bacterium]